MGIVCMVFRYVTSIYNTVTSLYPMGYNRRMNTNEGEFLPNRRLGRRPKYPWDEWMDGTEWTIWKDQDFTCSRASMRNILHQKVIDTPWRCEVMTRNHVDGRQGLTFRFFKEGTGPSPEPVSEPRKRIDISDDDLAKLIAPRGPEDR